MKTTKNWNNLSDEFLKNFYSKYPVLKKGQMVIFELLNIKEDPHNPGRLMAPFSSKVPSKDRVYDPYAKEYVDIAYVKSVGLDNKVNLGDIKFFLRDGSRIVLRGGRADDQARYEYLLLSNYREDNKARDISIKPKYKLVDAKRNAEAERKARKTMFLAIDTYQNMNDDKIKRMAIAMGYEPDTDMEIIRDEFEKMTTKAPEQFMKHFTDPMGERKAIIHQAITDGHIVWAPEDSKFEWKNGKSIAVIARGSGTDHVEELAIWTLKNDQTEAVYKEIARLVTADKKTKKKDTEEPVVA